MQVIPNVNKTKKIEDISAGEVFRIRSDYFLRTLSFNDSDYNTITCVGLADGLPYDFPEEFEVRVISGNFVED